VALGRQECRSLFVRNYSGGGVNSLSLYGSNVEQVVAGHEFRYSGIGMNYVTYGTDCGAFFNEFRDCLVVNGDGMESLVLVYYPDLTKPPGVLPYPMIAGCEWRGNELQDTGFYSYGGSPWGDPRWIEFHSQGALMVHAANYGKNFHGVFQYGLLVTGNHVVRARGGSGIFVGPDTSNVFVVGNQTEGCATPVSHYGRDHYVEGNQ
jgi:hypothetical protein